MKVISPKDEKRQTAENSEIREIKNLAKVFVETAFEKGFSKTEIDEIFKEVKKIKVEEIDKKLFLSQIKVENDCEKTFRKKVDKFLEQFDYLLEDSQLKEYTLTFGCRRWGCYRPGIFEWYEDSEKYNLPGWERLHYKDKIYNKDHAHSPMSISKTFWREVLCAAYKCSNKGEKISNINIFNEAKAKLKYELYDYVHPNWINRSVVDTIVKEFICPFLKETDGVWYKDFVGNPECFDEEDIFIELICLIHDI